MVLLTLPVLPVLVLVFVVVEMHGLGLFTGIYSFLRNIESILNQAKKSEYRKTFNKGVKKIDETTLNYITYHKTFNKYVICLAE